MKLLFYQVFLSERSSRALENSAMVFSSNIGEEGKGTLLFHNILAVSMHLSGIWYWNETNGE